MKTRVMLFVHKAHNTFGDGVEGGGVVRCFEIRGINIYFFFFCLTDSVLLVRTELEKAYRL